MNDDQVSLCLKCNETKPWSAFHVHKSGKKIGQLYTHCKACRKSYGQTRYASNRESIRFKQTKYRADNPKKLRLIHVKTLYGLSQKEYEAMPKECAICGSIENLQIDHNHTTNKVRDTLCGPCNLDIGHFKESPNLLIRATDYILKHFDQGPL